ncbi:phage tail protein [Pseudomonas monteilii SB3101]|uniref:Phage tail protein n=1 Tax=Pseudomonas monteilii SB3101 TaxID=1435058 RepID=V9UXY3_9PSED|nr:phage tail protein [Pseudomonas monteilii]AHC82703.1 phage tail protein [Pseudomonas monteilii SB3078]AHC88079.1 phage tail protein [Pseudomonas monteilii SB3101]
MAYTELLESSLSSLVAAGEAGRKRLDGMLGPLNGAISTITGAASELESLPFVSPEAAAKLGRLVRGINVAYSRAGQVASTYSRVVSGASRVQERLGTLKEMAGKVTSEARRISNGVSPSVANITPSQGLVATTTPKPEAVAPFPHLLIIMPYEPNAQPYYFNLGTAAFDELRRQASFRWQGQERLRRSVAQQAVGLGEEKITIKGAIFPHHKGGLKQLNTLRSIGRNLRALKLVTGYGEVLGDWCLVSIEEEQSHLLPGGIPRKQGFTLEFVSYGNDLQNV